jgi:hypothetical protein
LRDPGIVDEEKCNTKRTRGVEQAEEPRSAKDEHRCDQRGLRSERGNTSGLGGTRNHDNSGFRAAPQQLIMNIHT